MKEYLIIFGYSPTEIAYIIEAETTLDAVEIWKNSNHYRADYLPMYRVLPIQRVSAVKKLVQDAT